METTANETDPAVDISTLRHRYFWARFWWSVLQFLRSTAWHTVMILVLISFCVGLKLEAHHPLLLTLKSRAGNPITMVEPGIVLFLCLELAVQMLLLRSEQTATKLAKQYQKAASAAAQINGWRNGALDPPPARPMDWSSTSAQLSSYRVDASLLLFLLVEYGLLLLTEAQGTGRGFMHALSESTTSREVRAAVVFVLLLLRAARLVLVHTAAFTTRSREQELLLNMLRCQGLPVRAIVEGLAFLTACAGSVLLTTGGLTHLERQSVPFLANTLPAHEARTVAFVGLAMLSIAGGALIAARLSCFSHVTLAVLFGGAMLMWYVATLERRAHAELSRWRHSLQVGTQSLFSDRGLLEGLDTQDHDVDSDGQLEANELNQLWAWLEQRGGQAHVESGSAQQLLDDWQTMRRAFEQEWADCAGAVYNSSRVRDLCLRGPPDAESTRPPPHPVVEEAAAAEAAEAEAVEAAAAEAAEAVVVTPHPRTRWSEARVLLKINSTAPWLPRSILAPLASSATMAHNALVSTEIQMGIWRDAAADSWRTALLPRLKTFWGLSSTPIRSPACAYLPPPDRLVLYCSDGYLDRHGYDSPWHSDGRSSEPGHFGALASRWCLNEPIASLRQRLADPRSARCLNSTWWPSPPLTQPTTRQRGSRSSAIFAALGRSELPLSAKALFCLCEGSTHDYVRMTSGYGSTLEWSALPFAPLPFFVFVSLPIWICFCVCCPILSRFVDTSQYYDKDLL
jgi:hypothetical protein